MPNSLTFCFIFLLSFLGNLSIISAQDSLLIERMKQHSYKALTTQKI